MKWCLFLIVISTFMSCNSSKEVKQVYSERFTIERVEHLQVIDENPGVNIQSIRRILLGLEFGADSLTTYNQLQKKLQKESDSLFLFTFPLPQLEMVLKPYFYQNKLWKIELYEKYPQKREQWCCAHGEFLTTILSKYFPDQNINEITISRALDIRDEETSFKIIDNLMLAVRFHPLQGITVGYIDLCAIKQIENLKNKQIRDMAKDL